MKSKRVVVCFILSLVITLGVMTPANSQAATKKYTNQDLKIMSCIIYCEAGNQSYAGKKAVGIVIMNRVKSSSFPNSVRGVVYARGQFAPTWIGTMHKALVAYKDGKFEHGNRAECVKAAKAVLEGENYVVTRGKKISMRRFHFFNSHLSNAKLRISGHAFK